MTIPILYIEDQHDIVKEIADSDESVFWFIQLPEETATESGKPLTFYFTGACDLGMDAIEIDGMLQENLTIYRDSKVSESKGFPTVSND